MDNLLRRPEATQLRARGEAMPAERVAVRLGVGHDTELEILAAQLVERRSGKRAASKDDVVYAAARRRRRHRGAKPRHDALDGIAMGEIGAHERRW